MLAARFVQLARPQAQVFVGVPSWENHRAIFEAAGCTVQSHPYYDAERHAIDFDAMIAVLGRAPRGSAWVLHACCHNPTGMDLSEAQWERLVDLAAARELLPICDLAYQGFGLGLDEDRRVVRRLEARGFEFLVAHSMSKSFALYGERVGSLTAVMASPEQAKLAAATLRRVVRSSYSNPPTQGAALVAEVLNSPELAALWEGELDGMRSRIVSMRARLAEELARLAPSQDMSFTARQRGLFSYTGLTGAEVAQLREGHGIHLLETGRMCVAALNPGNLSAVVEGLGDVLRARPSRPNSSSAAAAAPR
jgi:aromatic-amino-acid transaminase